MTQPKDVQEQAKDSFKEKLKIVNDHLKGRKYFVGEHFTVADLAFTNNYYQILSFCFHPNERKAFQNVIDLINRCAEETSFKRIWGRVRWLDKPLQAPVFEKT